MHRDWDVVSESERDSNVSGAAAKPASESAKKTVAAAEAYLDAHSAEKFSLEKIARALYINQSYLLRVYKAATGQTLLHSHHRIRCEKAKRLLEETDLNMSAVSEMVGFVTPAHFSRVFRQMTGKTPSQYRKAQRDMYREEGS
ncbi:MAG: helix-turn-helix transcriptional regulator [Clostridia bacterium]|nr:helix-turn-helix transcriptional regulator [Clostridia bacterium]